MIAAYVLAFVVLCAVVVILVKSSTRHKRTVMEASVSATSSSINNAPTDEVRPQLYVIYGTETGTAEGIAHTFVQDARRYSFSCEMQNASLASLDTLPQRKVIVVIAATAGEGEPTSDMKEFCDWLQNVASPDTLQQTHFAVFALGDHSYKHYCKAGIDVDRMLSQAGAVRLLAVGCGDASCKATEQDFEVWSSDFWSALHNALGLKLRDQAFVPLAPKFSIEFQASDSPAAIYPRSASALEPTAAQPLWAPLAEKTSLLHNTQERTTLRILFDISSSQTVAYQAGDHLGVLPCNPDAVVAEYLLLLHIDEETSGRSFCLCEPETCKSVLPGKVSVRLALKWYFDLCGAPKRSTLRVLSQYCQDADEKAALERASSCAAAYNALTARCRNVSHVLRHFAPSCRVPLAHFMEAMPRLQPRYYSIASDSLLHPKTIAIVVGIVPGGVASSMLTECQCGESLPVFVRKSVFHHPMRSKHLPVVMIGAGTGIAPYLGFLERRIAWAKKGLALGDATLFFGCRKKEEDYIQQSFIEECARSGDVLAAVHTAFSRETAEKVYVQHRMREHGDEIWQAVSKGGAVFVCGDAKHMAKEVEEALIVIAQEKGSLPTDEAVRFWESLARKDKYLRDVWTV